MKTLVHDVSNELCIIEGLLRLIEKQVGIGEIKKLARTAKVRINTAIEMLRDNLTDEKKDIQEVLNETIATLAKDYEIKISVNFQNNTDHKVSKNQLRRILANIVKNAKESHSTELYIFVGRDYIAFNDNGEGFSNTVLDRIKEDKLFSTKPKGSGWGLKSLKRFAKLNGYRVKFSNGISGANIIFEKI